ncbi:MAG TPA: DUF4369 domain-containing protein, partial [Chitinophagaceae bacterium]
MIRGWQLPLILLVVASCATKSQEQFEVTGKVSNAPGKMVYLEETPLTTGQRIVADSFVIGQDGAYRLKGTAKEESLFSLFLKGENYPVAVLVNDASRITVNSDVAHPEDYKVAGSPGSIALHDFSMDATRKWSQLYLLGRQMDSLKSGGAPDSLLLATNQAGERQLK